MLRPLGIAAATALAASGLAAGAAPEVGARPAQTPPPCGFDYCVGDEIAPGPRPTVPGTGGTGPDGSGGSGGGPPAPVCRWVHWQDAAQNTFPLIPDPPVDEPEAELYLEECDGVATGRVRWIGPDESPPAAPLSPAQLARAARARLEGNLPAPSVTSSPAPGVAALVGFPSFVAVDNWEAEMSDRECDPNYGLCVEVFAEATLEWTPGEPGAGTIACTGAGTRFDPAGGSPDDQAAAPGACAHAYRSRTGVEGRPAAWPGEVAVRWELTWSSTAGGWGSLRAVTKTAAVPRAVDEVQTVVESAG
jgi:hypothetical protein